ncbi:MAG TPA: VOC family protein [Clostridium sp.]|uniref:VOC family protein n=1 Tax=Clostridium sp. TaxID=1506 RepID=UPI002F92E82D
MTKELWINLPVKDVEKSKEFFTKLGFSFDDRYNSNDGVSLIIGDKNIVVMLFKESAFKNFTGNRIPDLKQGTEVLFSLSAESKKEVDEMADKVVKAGGTIYAEAEDNDSWMYGCGFSDLDGHRWNVLYMDMSKMPN